MPFPGFISPVKGEVLSKQHRAYFPGEWNLWCKSLCRRQQGKAECSPRIWEEGGDPASLRKRQKRVGPEPKDITPNFLGLHYWKSRA